MADRDRPAGDDSAPAARPRRCRTSPQRTALAPASGPFVRHRGGLVVVLSRRRPPALPVPRRRGWMIAVVVAAVALVVNVVLTTGSPTIASVAGACAGSPSVAGGHTLWSRTEPADGHTTLVHLCVGPELAPVLGWTVRADDEAVAVVRLADRLAIAAVDATAGDVRLVVEVRTQAGTALRFRPPVG